ncbi:hypothetical protein [Kangiella sediminilitoris]|uniref:Uncharacterized protein n=1 Tax=Kangiella sediminilitoris TaxID=1144748 RepID=A0A1B3B816_9GAMM|nr:hypothetical protein [Kangiella sediminilitoris]AOE48942.1 hypothetical protein KS2013_214 [Kangiella sediminilitoris]
MYKRIKQYCLLMATCSLIFLFSSQAFSAEEKPAAMAEMWHFVIDPADGQAFEKAFKEHVEFRKNNGDTRDWWVYTPHTGVLGRDYYVRHCCFKWGQHQKYVDMEGMDKLSQDWYDGPAKYVKKTKHFYSWVDRENNHWPKDTKSNFLRLAHYKLKVDSDMGPVVKEISDLAKKIGWKRAWGWSYENNMDGTYLTLAMPSADFAGFESPNPNFEEAAIKEIGEEKYKNLFDRFDSNVESRHFRIMRYRPGLSLIREQ